MGKGAVEPGSMVRYIGDMLEELRDLAPEQAGRTLPYLIDMACLEARELQTKLDQGSSETRPPG